LDNESAQKKSSAAMTLTSLARNGKLTATDITLDFELIGANEKCLIAVGESAMSDWVQARRHVFNVTEANFLHMSREAINARLTALNPNTAGAAKVATLPALQVLRFTHNDFNSLRSVDFIHEQFSSSVEQLIIRGNPISAASSALLRNYMITTMPLLSSFNEEPVTPAERFAAERQCKPLLSTLSIAKSAAPQALQSLLNGNNNGVSNSSTNNSTNTNKVTNNNNTTSKLSNNNNVPLQRMGSNAFPSSQLKQPPSIKVPPNNNNNNNNMNKSSTSSAGDGLNGSTTSSSSLYSKQPGLDKFSDTLEQAVLAIIADTLKQLRPVAK